VTVASQPAALAVRNVVAGYGGGPVLRGVSLDVAPGEVVGLLGPNGSGKTTLLRVASRSLRPRSGRVLVAGHDPYALSARHAARLVAVVPQQVLPAFSFSALEVVLMGRSPHRSAWRAGGPEDWAMVREAMEATRVQHLADRAVDELSGGERQLVILAQALAQDAPVLLLDEPTTHLDLGHVVDLMATVRRLAGEGRAVLAVFHDLNLAAAACDRLVALAEGVVAAEGPPERVLTTEVLHRVFSVDAEVHPNPTTGRPLVALGPPPDRPPGRRRLRAHVIGGAGRGGPVMRALAQRGYEVSAGVLHGGDTDTLVAERLNLLRVSVPPFSLIDAASAEDCRRMMAGVDLLVVCDAPFGPGNLENLRLAGRAARAGTRVVLLEQIPMAERDFTGGVAGAQWAEIREMAEVAPSYEAVLSLV
jgi:iron complex transport system ATP-binding protein